MAYSTDLRERVVRAAGKMDKTKVAEVFQISYSTARSNAGPAWGQV